MTVSIHIGDCRDVMATLDPDSIDAIVCDPPYGLKFMGKAWDHGVPGVEFWTAALRVAKPGAYLLAFGGTRMFHRLAVAIEDAGWELRDTVPYAHEGVTLEPVADCPWLLAWVYGSGFPKSKNLGDGRGTALKPAWEPIIMARKPLAGTVVQNAEAFSTGVLNIDACRVATEDKLGGGDTSADVSRDGKHEGWKRPWMNNEAAQAASAERSRESVAKSEDLGRWPANLIHDGSSSVVAMFPKASGQLRSVGPEHGVKPSVNALGEIGPRADTQPRGDSGSAARFFYCAKADRADRNDGCDGLAEKPLLLSSGDQSPGTFQAEGTNRSASNNHPTVKPTELMRYLVRLVTPPGGMVLDPFMGSGSTGRAATAEGCSFTGIELDPDYAEIARRRIDAMQPGLTFSLAGES